MHAADKGSSVGRSVTYPESLGQDKTISPEIRESLNLLFSLRKSSESLSDLVDKVAQQIPALLKLEKDADTNSIANLNAIKPVETFTTSIKPYIGREKPRKVVSQNLDILLNNKSAGKTFQDYLYDKTKPRIGFREAIRFTIEDYKDGIDEPEIIYLLNQSISRNLSKEGFEVGSFKYNPNRTDLTKK